MSDLASMRAQLDAIDGEIAQRKKDKREAAEVLRRQNEAWDARLAWLRRQRKVWAGKIKEASMRARGLR